MWGDEGLQICGAGAEHLLGRKMKARLWGGLECPAVAVVLMDNGRGQQTGQGWMTH